MSSGLTNKQKNPDPRSRQQSDKSDDEYSEYSTTSSNNDSEYLSHIKFDGNIFFVKCSIVPTLNRIDPGASEDDHALFRSEYKRMSLRGPAKLMVRKMKDKNPFGIKVLKKAKLAEADKCVKEVILSINMKKIKPLNGVKFLERVLGIVPSVSLAKKLVVAQVKENCCFSKDGFVKPGDILKQIGHDSITNENLDMVLRNLHGTQIKICFHEMLESSPLNSIDVRITGLSDVLDNLHLLFGYEKPPNDLQEPPLSLMFISKVEDAENNHVTPTFSYPQREKNILFGIRGSFMTLQSILEANFQRDPTMTTIRVHRSLFHVAYKSLPTGLLLVAFNSRYVTAFESKKHATNFIENLKFLYKSESEAFLPQNLSQLQQICELKKVEILTAKKIPSESHFERLLPQPQFVSLPKEIQLRIDDAISELEAMDFFNWTDSETVIDALQELVIVGCAVFYKNFLISTHLGASYVQEIENAAKHLAIHAIMESTNVKKLIIWQQIHAKEEPKSEKRKFVVFTSQGKLLMAAIMEEKVVKKNPSSLKTSLSYYVEEMQDILEYFRLTGVENLTRIWISSNKRPEILQPTTSNGDFPTVLPQKSVSLRDSTLNSDDSDSDWEEGLNSGRGSSSGFDMSECSDIIYKDFQEIIPSILNSGAENLLFHFVQVEFGDGVLIAPTVQSNFAAISNAFRKTCVVVHHVLQNTVKFRKILANNEPNWNQRSMVAIKEHGVLIQSATASQKKTKNEEFWVIGRLFSSPPRELYVCHRSNTPQNMVELAFKICMGGAG
ncbi:protein inturned [Culicoides brevitarsis]|uniref:protein inturned n=1 Tax=Culicoides brevitarsis TaxID=469753 RepID=UPI00307CC6DA